MHLSLVRRFVIEGSDSNPDRTGFIYVSWLFLFIYRDAITGCSKATSTVKFVHMFTIYNIIIVDLKLYLNEDGLPICLDPFRNEIG